MLSEVRGWGWIVLVAAFWIMVAVAIVAAMVEEGDKGGSMQRCVEHQMDEGLPSESAIAVCE